jgi:hypothetical protein
MQTYWFSLIVAGKKDFSDAEADALYEAGCDDGTLVSRCGVASVGFAREAESLGDAIGCRVEEWRGGGRSVSTPRSSNRTGGFPASGSRTRKHSTQPLDGLNQVGRRLRIWTVESGGNRFAPLSLAVSSVCALLELRPLSSTGVTRLPRYYEPDRHPKRPGLSLAGVRLGSRFPPNGASRVAAGSRVSTCRHQYPGGTAGSDRSG